MNQEMTKAWRHFVLLRSCFFLSDRRVPPGECGSTSSDENPGTNGVIIKLAAEHGIKAKSAILQALNLLGGRRFLRRRQPTASRTSTR
jgi:hypothetical protein